MAIYQPTPGFKGRTFKLCVLTRWDFNLCVHSFPLRGFLREKFFFIDSVVITYEGKISFDASPPLGIYVFNKSVLDFSFEPQPRASRCNVMAGVRAQNKAGQVTKRIP